MTDDTNVLTYAPVHPHVCGEHRQLHYAMTIAVRFIPTCVGNIQRSAIRIVSIGSVHPHVCGEHLDIDTGSCDPVHPHVCGEHHLTTTLHAVTVHPHVCGEHRHCAVICTRIHRFIPTCVGNIVCSLLNLIRCNRFIPTCVGNSVHILYEN